MSWKERALKDDGQPLKDGGGWRSRALPEKPEGSPSKAGAAAQAGLEGFGDAATLGYLPHIQAGVAGLTPDPNASVDEQLRAQGFTINEQDDSYLTRRDANLKRQKKQREEHPVASGIGTGAGILATAAVPVGAAAKGASLAEKAYKGARAGAALGAAVNPGDTENEISPLQPDARLKNAAVGAVLGGAAPVAVEGVTKGAKATAEYLRKKAALKATRALGRPTPTLSRKMSDSGQDVALGRELLDSKAVPVLGTPGRIAKRVDRLKDQAGQDIESLVSSAGSGKVVDAEQMALDILNSPEVAAMRTTPGMESTVAAIEKQAETLFKNGKLSVKEAQALRQAIDKSINFNKAAPDMRGAQEGLYRQRTAIRGAMNDAINALPGTPSKDALLKANRRFGNLADAEEILEREVARNQTNRAVSLTDTIAAAGGVSSGNPGLGLALGAINKAGRTFGNSIQARGFDAASRQAASVASAGAKVAPGAASQTASRAGTMTPEMERDPDPILNDPRLMKLFQDDPTLIEAIRDERTKDKVKRALAGGAAPAPKGGPDRWARTGADRLGISGDEASRLMQSKRGKQLLIEASDLKPGSKRLQSIKEQIQRGVK
jgi:hypothetical protein